MADESIGADIQAPNQTETPSPSHPPESSPQPTQTQEAPQQQSFGDALRATAAPPSTFTQADIDARLTTERETWQREAEAREAEKWAWAQGLDQNEVQNLRTSIEEARTDPVGVATRLLAASLASGNPQHRQAALSFAGRLLAGRTGTPAQAAQPAAEAEPQPDVPARDEQGNTIPLYSGPQMLKVLQYHMGKLREELTGQLQPIQQAHQTQAERQAAYEQQQRDQTTAQAIFTKMTSKPGFKDHQAEIVRVWETMPLRLEGEAGAREALADAYEQVVFGKLQASSVSSTAADNARRTAANTGRVVTSQPTQSSPAAPTSIADKIAQAMAKQRSA